MSTNSDDNLLNLAINAELDYHERFGPMDVFGATKAEETKLAGLRAVAAAAWCEAMERAVRIADLDEPCKLPGCINPRCKVSGELREVPNPYSQNALVTDKRTKK